MMLSLDCTFFNLWDFTHLSSVNLENGSVIDIGPNLEPEEDDGSLKIQSVVFEKAGEALLSGGSGTFPLFSRKSLTRPRRRGPNILLSSQFLTHSFLYSRLNEIYFLIIHVGK